MGLVSDVRRLQKSPISKVVRKRLAEFKRLGKSDDWFSELCFCILTANSKARTAIAIQKKLGAKGFSSMSEKRLAKSIREHKHRFHNNKASYICLARKSGNLKAILLNEREPREWLVDNVKGLGWKEASHFLRNIGYMDYAILDRHILALMLNDRLIAKRPKTLNKKAYLEIERKLRKVAGKLKISLAELDLYMWYMKTGEVLK